MKKIIITIIFFFAITSYSQEKIVPNPIAIELARSFTKDIFDLNGTDIVEPSVRVINSVSNDRFYQSAYIPYKENKFYVRVELNGMYGSVPNDMKTFTPEIPQEKYNNDSLIISPSLKSTDVEFLVLKENTSLYNPCLSFLIAATLHL